MKCIESSVLEFVKWIAARKWCLSFIDNIQRYSWIFLQWRHFRCQMLFLLVEWTKKMFPSGFNCSITFRLFVKYFFFLFIGLVYCKCTFTMCMQLIWIYLCVEWILRRNFNGSQVLSIITNCYIYTSLLFYFIFFEFFTFYLTYKTVYFLDYTQCEKFL